MGRGKKYHPGMVYHHSSLSGDGRVKFLFDSKDSLFLSKGIGEKGWMDV
jgi:hypothetical protein